MPYIKAEKRERIRNRVVKLSTPGELNFAISELLTQYLEDNGAEPPRYEDMNEVLGAIEAAKLEFARRVMAPYEDKKIRENGDLPGYESTDYRGTVST